MVVPYHDEIINGKMPIAYVVPVRELTNDEMDEVVSNIIQTMIDSDDTNNRDIPRKICFIDEMPTNAMSKNDFRTLISRMLDGSEYTIEINETNLSSGDIRIISPERDFKKQLVSAE